jgi:hypothetical protein
MTQTLACADIRGYYAALGIQIPGWARTEASIRCFAGADAHQRGDRDPSCSVNLEMAPGTVTPAAPVAAPSTPPPNAAIPTARRST